MKHIWTAQKVLNCVKKVEMLHASSSQSLWGTWEGISVKLCAIWVALKTEAEIELSAPTVYACEKILSQVGYEPMTPRIGGWCSTGWATAAVDYICIIAEREGNAAMRFTANKNVAFSASTITA